MFFLNEAETKKLAKLLTRNLKKTHTELAMGQVLDALAATRGHKDWNSLSASLSRAGIDAMLAPMELDHAHDSQDAELRLEETGMNGFGPECILKVHTGFELRIAAYPLEVDYVRVCDPLGREIAYWSIDEVKEDPADVLGALVGALARGQGAPLQQASAVEPVAPVLEDLDFDYLTAVRIDGGYFRVDGTDMDALETLRKCQALKAAGQELDEEDLEQTVLELSQDEDGLCSYEQLTVAQLLSLTWSADDECFVDAEGSRLEFILAHTFGKSIR